jgi:NAD(P)-dependent dehydrogenase (short-subunit alcohol dehydrogenase family)
LGFCADKDLFGKISEFYPGNQPTLSRGRFMVPVFSCHSGKVSTTFPKTSASDCYPSEQEPAMHDTRKSVVITGASSGIGRACVLRLSQAGWQVFATVRKEQDREKLQHQPGIFPLIIDMQDAETIKAAAAQVEAQLQGRGLDGLVNVAGIGMVRPLEYASMHEVREIFEVNFFGQVEVIQAFSRLIRKQRGRIVNITTVGVNLALPFGSLLNASKSAFAMVNDSLRLELHPFGVRVSAIEPGAISTAAVDKTLGDLERVIEALPPEAQEQYGSIIRNFGRRGYEMEKNGSPPEVVAAAVHHALTSSRPRIRYRVGKHAKLLATLPKILPESLLDVIRLRMTGLSTPAEERGGRVRDRSRARISVQPVRSRP